MEYSHGARARTCWTLRYSVCSRASSGELRALLSHDVVKGFRVGVQVLGSWVRVWDWSCDRCSFLFAALHILHLVCNWTLHSCSIGRND